MSGRGGLRTVAPAKLNLTLEVLGKRADGYHEIVHLAQTVDWADTLTLEPGPGREVRFVHEWGRTPLSGFADELIGRAWELLAGRYETAEGARVTVRKRVPASAGLGGGSSDAAAFLRLARAWWQLPIDEASLRGLAAEVGSDVPLFLCGGMVLVEGRGERVTPLADSTGWSALVYTPELPAPAEKTRRMYGALRPRHYGDGRRARALRERLAAGRAPAAGDLGNVFDAVADELQVGLREARRRVAAATGQPPTLAGAGPSLFVVGKAARLAAAVAQLDGGPGHARLVRPLPRASACEVVEAEAGETGG